MRAMKTTLDIAEDVLQAAEEIGLRENKPVGEVISELVRRALATDVVAEVSEYARALQALPSLPRRCEGIATMADVNRLRDLTD